MKAKVTKAELLEELNEARHKITALEIENQDITCDRNVLYQRSREFSVRMKKFAEAEARLRSASLFERVFSWPPKL